MNKRLLKYAKEHKLLPEDTPDDANSPIIDALEKYGLSVANDCMLNAWWAEGHKDPEKTISNLIKKLYGLK